MVAKSVVSYLLAPSDFCIIQGGTSLGPTADQSMAEADIINLRVPYQSNAVMRGKINKGEIVLSLSAVYNELCDFMLQAPCI